jgi:hypothetical protein
MTMETFKADKSALLKKSNLLRIMNYIGMIAWNEDDYGDAKEKLRLIHPLTWLYILCVILGSILEFWAKMFGDLKETLKNDTVWF